MIEKLTADRIPGDVNDDGIVSIADVLMLARYLADYDEKINEANANVNGDNMIGNADLLLLARYLVDYPGAVLQ